MDRRLYTAASKGDVKLLNDLADTNPLILDSATSPLGNTALHIAATFGNITIVNKICQQRGDLIVRANKEGDFPLHCAARSGQIDIVKILIGKSRISADLENGDQRFLRATNSLRNTPLHEAAKNGHGEVALTILEADHEVAWFINNAEETPLYIAAREGLAKVVEQILKTSPSVINIRGPDGQTPLHAAAMGLRSGNRNAMEVLLKETSQPHKFLDNHFRNALHYAAWKGIKDIAGMLLEKDPSLGYQLDKDGYSPLLTAADFSQVLLVEVLLSYCPDAIEQVLPNGRTVLHLAILNSNHVVIKGLLQVPEVERLINVGDKNGDTPLHLALIHSDYLSWKVVLEEKNVDLNIANNEGDTALQIAFYDLKPTRQDRRILVNSLIIRGAVLVGQQMTKIGKRKTTHLLLLEPEHFKSMAKSYTFVAALIATVAFAAAITLPGGYTNQGTVTLAKNVAFKVFVISNTIAMCFSLTVVVWLSSLWLLKIGFVDETLTLAHRLILIACGALMVSLMTGIYAVVAKESKWLAIVVCVVGCISILFMVAKSTLVFHVKWFWGLTRGFMRYKA